MFVAPLARGGRKMEGRTGVGKRRRKSYHNHCLLRLLLEIKGGDEKGKGEGEGGRELN